MSEATLLSALMMGLLGGVHCAAMCGPIVVSLSAIRSQTQPTKRPTVIPITAVSASDVSAPTHHLSREFLPQLGAHLAYSTGRVSAYTAMGALAGALGAGLWDVMAWLPVQALSIALMAASLMLVGLYLTGWRAVADASEAIGRPLWRVIQPLAAASLRKPSGNLQLISVGAIWGFLPCGMVYSALLMAFASADPALGALILLAFGLGTVPNLLLIGTMANAVTSFRQSIWVRRIIGAVIFAYGLSMLLRMTNPAAISPLWRLMNIAPYSAV